MTAEPTDIIAHSDSTDIASAAKPQWFAEAPRLVHGPAVRVHHPLGALQPMGLHRNPGHWCPRHLGSTGRFWRPGSSARRISNRFSRDYRALNRTFNPGGIRSGCVGPEILDDAGMRYVALTTKHHDGFCMFDTATTGLPSHPPPTARSTITRGPTS